MFTDVTRLAVLLHVFADSKASAAQVTQIRLFLGVARPDVLLEVDLLRGLVGTVGTPEVTLILVRLFVIVCRHQSNTQCIITSRNASETRITRHLSK